MSSNRRTILPPKALWLLPPILLGIAVLLWAKNHPTPPVTTATEEQPRTVRTITVPEVDLTPVATGYGVVQPTRVWSAVAQVNGRIVEMHPRLRDGEIIAKDTLLFRIDPTDYQLTLEQRKAELTELTVRQENAEQLLQIELRNLELATRESQRLQRLIVEGSISQSRADEAERAMLNSRTAVQNLRNTLALLPSQHRVAHSRLQQAERDLDNTEIHAPFNLRISALGIETDQYVTRGQTLFKGDGTDQIEVVAQLSLETLSPLFLEHDKKGPSEIELTEGLAEYTGLNPQLELDMGRTTARWQARFVRFTDRYDSETRTIGVVVALDNPLQQIIPGERPPLSRGMFVRVRLQGRTQPQRILIPRSAIRNGEVLRVNADQRLQRAAVKVLYHQHETTVIASGITAGDQLVVSDLIPAISGMLLRPQPDLALQQQLTATGAER